ncbi:MAG: M14 family zinc carboxypeptidase [Phycisphaerae bacterium]
MNLGARWIIVSALILSGGQTGRGEGPSAGFEPYLLEIRPPADARNGPGDVRVMRQWRDWLLRAGFSVDRCGVDVAGRRIALDIEAPDQVQQLEAAGFSILNRRDPVPLGGPARGGPQAAYFDPLEIETMLAQVAVDHPTLTNVFTIGTTFQGRDIWAIEISDQPGIDEDEPAIQFNGQHHARELATSHVVMDIVNFLTDSYGSDMDVTAWVNQYKTVCVPMVNPDGVQYVFDVNNLWRKNRRGNSGCITGCGGTGVDLNRNYPYLWGPGCGSSGCCVSEIFRGSSALSEQDSLAMLGLQNAYHFVMATSYHAFGRFIDYPYACSNGSPSQQMPEHPVIHEMMNGMADAISAVDGVTYTAFSPVPFGGVNGDDTSWYYAHKGVYPFIVEVGTTFEPLFSDVAGIVNRNRAGWQYLYNRLGEARIDVHVTDGCQPMTAQITLTDYIFDTGELPRLTFLPFGRWTFVVPPGATYTVRVSRSGFVTQDIPVTVGNTPVAVNIALQRVNPPLMGDLNSDCAVDGLDIDLFVQAVLDGSAANPTLITRGDFTGDCIVDGNDVSPFVQAVLAGDTCP